MEERELLKEKKYLNIVNEEIETQIKRANDVVEILQKERKDFSKYYAEDYYTMDTEEALSDSGRLAEIDNLIFSSKKQQEKLNRMKYSPYFGKIKFQENNQPAKDFYIGVNSLTKIGKAEPFVCDWRAPVSSLFYDYELGTAKFDAPDGECAGEILQKRQFDIKNGQMLKCFDSSLTIGDEVLKEVLSLKASTKMKAIVSTIQKQQNQIIRLDKNKNMLVQGVAGSGKTSIALHRVAFLLYQHKDTLKAEDVLILSPNKLFGEYIADVLPELGEENMMQMSFYRLAQKELNFIGLNLEKREDALEELTQNISRLNEVAYKNTYEFYDSLKQFCAGYFNLIFKPKDFKIGETLISAKDLEKLYNTTYKSKTPAVRVEWLVDYILDLLNFEEDQTELAQKIKNKIYPFFEETNVLKIYADFLANIGMTMSLTKDEKLRYDDLAPIMYITNYYFGLSKYKEVKYLIIDEMQDYSFVHFDVFNSIFDCNKTVLGDIDQCIEKVMTENDINILKDMLSANLIELNKAYRSTYEISNFASKIKGIQIDAIKRNGDEPIVKNVNKANLAEEIENIVKSNTGKIAILTENKYVAKNIYSMLYNLENVSLNINYDEELADVCIMPTFMAKGLEFDVAVVIKSNNVLGAIENNLYYVACTRAMHKLFVLQVE